MSRIAPVFAKLKSEGRKALIPFVTAGFPFADVTPDLMHGMVAGGADVIELGVPFSDPSADGPVIQKGRREGFSQRHWPAPGAGDGSYVSASGTKRRPWC
jgi:tryptophan synthase alpha chain